MAAFHHSFGFFQNYACDFHMEVYIMILLIDERPEEVTDM